MARLLEPVLGLSRRTAWRSPRRGVRHAAATQRLEDSPRVRSKLRAPVVEAHGARVHASEGNELIRRSTSVERGRPRLATPVPAVLVGPTMRVLGARLANAKHAVLLSHATTLLAVTVGVTRAA